MKHGMKKPQKLQGKLTRPKGMGLAEYKAMVAWKCIQLAVREADGDETVSPNLAHGWLTVGSGKARFMGTDGHRMFVVTGQADLPESAKETTYKVTPKQLADAVNGCFTESPEECELFGGAPWLKELTKAADANQNWLICSLVQLHEELKRVAALQLGERTQTCVLVASAEWQELQVRGQLYGESYLGKLDAQVAQGSSETVNGLQTSYLGDALQACAWILDYAGVPRAEQEVEIRWADTGKEQLKAITIKPFFLHASTEWLQFESITMPCKVD